MSTVCNKVILLIFDGLGDRPSVELGGKTPLEAAVTPNLDALCASGISGMMHPVGRGHVPGSDIAHLSLFGYPADKYYSGRGPIEVAGLGISLKHGDVALRGNLGTVDDGGIILDRRAGRITDVSAFAEALDGTVVDGVQFIVKKGTAHRVGIIMRGEDLSAEITDADPHADGEATRDAQALDNSTSAIRTAAILSKFLKQAHEVLRNHPANIERVKQGLLPANFLLVRGAGFYKAVPSLKDRYGFHSACVAGGGLYKGIGAFLGMHIQDVPGATALPNTDIKAKFEAARSLLATYDFVFVHVKATDSLGEDGKPVEKKQFIERADQAMSLLRNLDRTLLVVTGDHSTPCSLKKHSADPVPVMAVGAGVRVDSVTEFGERTCTAGGLGFIHGLELMPEIVNWLGHGKLEGA